jgi:RNA polymerase sigma factor (sigma-70 family)
MEEDSSIHQTVDHLFRHQSGKMVAVLSKLLGLEHLDAAQDIVQDTLLQALNTWSYKGIPDNPAAWLYRVAKNRAIDRIRRDKTFRKASSAYGYLLDSEYTLHPTINGIFQHDEIEDSQLRMMFACCHPSIPVDSQIAFTLKTLCGLSAAEIARAFLAGEETISKRIYRAKEKIKAENIQLEMPHASALPERTDAVLHCLYLLFNEGYNSSHPDRLIREELCEEAVRLAYMLTQHSITNLPRTNALLALFCFQASRFPARMDDQGNIILLKQQDRSLWYRPLINKGYYFLETATVKETSVYHLEAAVAYLHAKAPSFEETDWKAIYYLYEVLYKQHPSPFIALNKAIAAMYARDASAALTELLEIKGLDKYYLYHTALGEIHVALACVAEAKKHFQRAMTLTRSSAERQLLNEKLRNCDAIISN